MRKFILMLTLLAFVGLQGVFAQTSVTGTVTSSEDGGTLPGVSVVVEGTSLGTTTDMDGKFNLSVPADATALVFSFVGMQTQTIAFTGQTVITVVMKASALDLDEFVVTALGISREKKSLGYAVENLGEEALGEVRASNPVAGLSGKASGVKIIQPNTMGGSANIVIRGNASITQNNQALFVVDGVPISNTNTSTNQDGWGGYDYGNAASDINPDDIASVSVLKGAAATALYGSRAANGVIEITTKKGTKRDGIGITINSGVTFNSADPASLPKQQYEYGGGYGPFYDNEGVAGVGDYYFFWADINGDGQKDLITPTSEDASWGQKFDPNIMVVQWDALDPNKPNFGVATPWVAPDPENRFNRFFSTGVRYTNNVTFEGGDEKGTFRLSYTNDDETGILPNSSIKKNTLNFSGSRNLTDKLTVDANFTYTNQKAVGRYGTGYDGGNVMQSFGQWFQVNVDFQKLEELYLREDGSQLSWNSAYYDDLHPIYFDNPYWVRYKNYNDDHRNRIFGYSALGYKFNDWVSAKAKVSIDSYTEVQNERIAIGSVDQSKFSSYTRQSQELNYDFMLNFNKRFDNISVTGIVGTNVRRNTIESVFGSTVGGLVVPDLWAISNSVSPVSVSEALQNWGTNSAYASVSFGYNDFWYVDVTDRYDVSSTLPEGNNGFNYYSASTSLLLTELDMFKDLPALSFLKLRANYAEVGNDAPVYSLFSTYAKGTNWGNDALFSVSSTMLNPNLRPERTKSFEIGLEANLFDNRLRADVAYYNNRSIDQLMPVTVSPLSGYSSIWMNSGEIENKGLELSLTANVMKTADFNWDLSVNWYKNNNKVIRLYESESGESVDNMLIMSAWDVSINAKVGEPYGVIRGIDFVYTNGEPTVNASGFYMMGDKPDAIIGNIQPDWNAGLSSRMSYKGFSLNVLFDGQKGGDIYSVNTKYGQATGVYAETAGTNQLGNPMRDPVLDANGNDLGSYGGVTLANASPLSGGYVLPGVKEDGTPNDILIGAWRWGRAWYYSNSPTARYVFDASYIKFRELSVGYTLNKSLVAKTPFSNVTFSIVGRNLAILFKNTEHFDPEMSLGSGNAQGIESGAYPTTRSIGFNLKLGI
ncbi:MAG: SusC/RagA family TonB-linked outer membrane protein [Bacteroidales bacterium]|nr:SusC/RagA family TonB-linked outer membrane protein [Bacteroidales bacterium]